MNDNIVVVVQLKILMSIGSTLGHNCICRAHLSAMPYMRTFACESDP